MADDYTYVTAFTLDERQYRMLRDRAADMGMSVREYVGLCLQYCESLPHSHLLGFASYQPVGG